MKNTIHFILFCCAFMGCQPTDISLKKGDNWVEELYKTEAFGGLQNIKIYDDKLYCNSIHPGYSSNFYCFDLNTGQVNWVNQIDAYCASPPLVSNDIIYSITYVGHIYAFDATGNLRWENKGEIYESYVFNPLNENLLISSATNGIMEYDKYTGKLINQIGKATWQPANPVFFNDTMIISGLKSLNNDTLNNGNDIVCFKYKNMKELWRKKGYMGNFFKYLDAVYYLVSVHRVIKIS